MEEGFGREEARHLSFLIKSQSTGKAIGLAVGTAAAITWKHWYGKIATYIPLLAIKQRHLQFLFQLGIVAVLIHLTVGMRDARRLRVHVTQERSQ